MTLCEVYSAVRLTAEFGRGFSWSNLQNMRLFFLAYRDRLLPKCQMPSSILIGEKKQAASSKSAIAASTARADQQPHFQKETRSFDRTHPPQRCQYPRQFISALFTIRRGFEAATARVGQGGG